MKKIKADTPEPHPQVIPEVDKTPRSDTRVEITSTQKYNTRSSTNRFNHATTFKNAPSMCKMDTEEIIKTHIGTDYFSCINLKYKQSQ